jgi:glycosyltransferase involved in cell wall biosynthesis
LLPMKFRSTREVEAPTLSPECLRVLFTAYPLLPVSEESCGGAEQVLTSLEAELARRGHQTVVAACGGSRVTGALLPTGTAPSEWDRLEEREAEHTRRMLGYLTASESSADNLSVLHDHSGGFWRHASAARVPVLATLHLPRGFYREEWLRDCGANVFFNCVSDSQRRSFADIPRVIGTVRNGIDLSRFPFRERKQDYLLWMGRLCEEKGAHIAIRLARAVGMKLVIAGGIYPFSYHHRYFDREIKPHIGAGMDGVVFVDTPGRNEKLELLSGARALLVSSLVDETSSLVAMEAMACGTPVVAFRRGALPEVVLDGLAGLLATNEAGMAEATRQVDCIDPRKCREHAEANFSAERMADEYLALYRELLGSEG